MFFARPNVSTDAMTRPPLVCALLLALLTSGCGRVVFRPDQPQPQPVALTPQQQQQLAQQQQDLQRRADQLDRDNQELESLLAQSRQQSQLLNDQVVATQSQLKATTERLASSEKNNSDLQQRTQELIASTKKPIGSTVGFKPNSTLTKPLEMVNLPGVDARQDGDVIRVSIQADQVFYSDSQKMQPTGERVVESVASQLLSAYPGHLIGIEGHTDGAPIRSAEHSSAHHLTVAQATSVYDLLRRSGAPAAQLFVIGHGANHPIVSNATEAGRKKNRRIEMVVYPETVRRR